MIDTPLRVARRVRRSVIDDCVPSVSPAVWRTLWDAVRGPIANRVGSIHNNISEVLEEVDTYVGWS